METLPPELLRKICDNFKSKKSTLKAVRLVNKSLAGATIPLLFHTLLVYQTPQSWKKLSSVASCAWLAPYVIRLEIVALNYLPHLFSLVEWQQFTWHNRWQVCYHLKTKPQMVVLLFERMEFPLKATSPLPGRHGYIANWKQRLQVCDQSGQNNEATDIETMSSESSEELSTTLRRFHSVLGLVKSYERYRYWHDGENELIDVLSQPKGPDSLLDLVPFPNLRIVAVLGEHEIWEDKSWPSAPMNPRYRETAIRKLPRAQRETWENRYLLSSLTLQTLDASGKNITRLELHRYKEMLTGNTVSIPHHSRSYKSLSSISLTIKNTPRSLFGCIHGSLRLGYEVLMICAS